MKVIVFDLETPGKEFELVSIDLEKGICVIKSEEYGHCRQFLSLIEFKNNHVDDPLTKDQAYKAMLAGQRVKGPGYTDDEYAFINADGKIQTEEGCVHGTWFDEFWAHYQREGDWYIVPKEKE